MIRVNRASLKLLSIAIGLLFTAAVYHTMHNNPRWDWTAPGIGKLPQEVVRGFLHEAYAKGRGGTAAKGYFATDAKDNASTAQDRRDGPPIQHDVRSIIAQGMNVAVVHRIAPARGEPQSDVIDIFRIKEGRIIQRDRYLTSFGQQAEKTKWT